VRSEAFTVVLLASIGCAHGGGGGSAPEHERPRSVLDRCHPAERPYSRFELAVAGSGGPFAGGRASASYVVFLDGAARVLVDVGSGAFVRLGEMGIDLTTLDTLLLTHLHIDHAGDVAGFVKSRDLSADGPMTFRVFGPLGGGDFPPTTLFIDRLFGAQGAFAYLPKFRNPLHFEVTDLPTLPGAPIRELFSERDLRVTSIAVDHDDVPAVAFRIEHAGRAVVVSGDLASKNDNLTRLAAGADLLVYDTSVLDPPGSPQALYDLHTSPHRIGEVAAAARVGSLLLSHITPQIEKARAQVLEAVQTTYKGKARFAEDCMQIDLMAP
jgi:ribonuclease BN (tRNA processing enzyme)